MTTRLGQLKPFTISGVPSSNRRKVRTSSFRRGRTRSRLSGPTRAGQGPSALSTPWQDQMAEARAAGEGSARTCRLAKQLSLVEQEEVQAETNRKA